MHKNENKKTEHLKQQIQELDLKIDAENDKLKHNNLIKEEMYTDTNLDQIKEKYQELEEVVQNTNSTENIEKLPETESSEIAEYEEEIEEI